MKKLFWAGTDTPKQTVSNRALESEENKETTGPRSVSKPFKRNRRGNVLRCVLLLMICFAIPHDFIQAAKSAKAVLRQAEEESDGEASLERTALLHGCLPLGLQKTH